MLASLLRASISGAIGAALVWVICRLLPKLSASTRTALWWCAAAKFVIALLWLTPISLPILPVKPAAFAMAALGALEPLTDRPLTSSRTIEMSPPSPTTRASVLERGGDPYQPRDLLLVVQPAHAESLQARAKAAFLSVWSLALVAAWGAGVLLALGVSVRQWRRAMALVARSTQASAEIVAMVARLSSCLHLSRVPVACVSDEIDTPLVVGFGRPVVLLPSQVFARLSDRQQEMSICHELAHIKRRDLWCGCVPALAEALFFFHPLAKLAAREYALSREAACDAAVMDALDAAPIDYGRLLLDLGVTRPRMGVSVAGASWSSSILKRRLVMLNDASTSSPSSRLLAAVAIVVACIAILPMQLVARTPGSPSESSSDTAAQMKITVDRSLAGTTTSNSPRPIDAELHRTLQESRQAVDGYLPGLDTRTDEIYKLDLRFEYVLMHDDENVTWGRLSGVSQAVFPQPPPKILGEPGTLDKEVDMARRQKKPGEPLFWFTRHMRTYVIRDQATLRDIDAIWKPRTPLRNVSSTPAVSVSRARQLRDLTDVERASAKRELDTRMRVLNDTMTKLTTLLQKSGPGELGDRMEAVGTQLKDLGLVMQQAARPGEADLLRILDRAVTNHLVTTIPNSMDRMPILSGLVTTEKGTPDPNVRVMLFSSNRQTWIDRGMSAQSVPTDNAGRYSLRINNPGDYFVLAVPADEFREWIKADQYPKLATVATRIHVVESGESRQNLRTVR